MIFGLVQQELLRRGRQSSASMIYVTSYRELRSARKLVKHGLLVQQGHLLLFFLKEDA